MDTVSSKMFFAFVFLARLRRFVKRFVFPVAPLPCFPVKIQREILHARTRREGPGQRESHHAAEGQPAAPLSVLLKVCHLVAF